MFSGLNELTRVSVVYCVAEQGFLNQHLNELLIVLDIKVVTQLDCQYLALLTSSYSRCTLLIYYEHLFLFPDMNDYILLFNFHKLY